MARPTGVLDVLSICLLFQLVDKVVCAGPAPAPGPAVVARGPSPAPNLQGQCNTTNNVHYFGSELVTYTGDYMRAQNKTPYTAQECCNMCTENPNCYAYTSFPAPDNTCELKWRLGMSVTMCTGLCLSSNFISGLPARGANAKPVLYFPYPYPQEADTIGQEQGENAKPSRSQVTCSGDSAQSGTYYSELEVLFNKECDKMCPSQFRGSDNPWLMGTLVTNISAPYGFNVTYFSMTTSSQHSDRKNISCNWPGQSCPLSVLQQYNITGLTVRIGYDDKNPEKNAVCKVVDTSSGLFRNTSQWDVFQCDESLPGSVASVHLKGKNLPLPICELHIHGVPLTKPWENGTAQTTTTAAKSSSNTGVIAGAAGGGVAVLAAALILLLCCCRRKGRGFWSGKAKSQALEPAKEVGYEAGYGTGSAAGQGGDWRWSPAQGGGAAPMAAAGLAKATSRHQFDTAKAASMSPARLPDSAYLATSQQQWTDGRPPSGRLPAPASGGSAAAIDSADLMTYPRGMLPLSAYNTDNSSSMAPPDTRSGGASSGRAQRSESGASNDSFEWEIRRDQLEFCKREDGSDWVLGTGGFGKVYKAIMNGVTPVAVKIMLDEETAKQVDAMSREVAILRACHDRNVVSLLGTCLEPRVMLVTEYCERGDLWRLVGNDGEGELLWYRRGREIALDIARGLVYLHSKGIVHFDLKSPNILLDAKDTAKVADVGLSKLLHRTQTIASAVGTFAWAAPEQILGQPCSEKADIWSFGIILWEIVTGEHPKGRSMRAIRAPEECPLEIVQLVQACTDADQRKRPSARDCYNIIASMPSTWAK